MSPLPPNWVDGFANYDVILKPDRDEAQWWAGAPSVVQAPDGRFYLAARMREAESPRGFRGYEIRLLTSNDGRTFEPVASIHRDEVQLKGFERPALVVDPATGKFRLYVCGPAPARDTHNRWGIFAFDPVEDLRHIDRASMRLVLPPVIPDPWDDVGRGYKDPFIFHDDRCWHMFVIGYDFIERTYHFTSANGDDWQADDNNPVLDAGGWHNFFTRPACVLPMPVGFLFVYEGSDAGWPDPGYNIATGLAYTLDLSTITDLTSHAPVLKSTTPGSCHTWRYSCWLQAGDELHVFAEVTCANDTNEIRRFVLPAG